MRSLNVKQELIFRTVVPPSFSVSTYILDSFRLLFLVPKIKHNNVQLLEWELMWVNIQILTVISETFKIQMLTLVLPVSLLLPPSGQRAFLLENVPCNTGSCHSVGRMFHIHWDQSDLGAIQNAVMATFFDIYEDVSWCCQRPHSHSFHFCTHLWLL